MKFEKIKQQALAEWEEFVSKDHASILVGSGTCGRAAGALEVLSAFQNELSARSLADDVKLVQVGCLGLCYAEPLVEIKDDHGKRILYQGVNPEIVPELVEFHLERGEPVLHSALGIMEGEPINGIPLFSDLPMIKRQFRIALHNCGHINPTNINHYIARGGYSSLASVLTMDPEDVIDIVEKSLLRGRGGAGFPTGLKWRFCRNAPGDIRYLICNGDEGDPGAFMDRSLMEGDPHAIIEGMLIGAWAIGAQEGALYVRGEYPLAIKHLELAITQARDAGLLGKRVMDTDFGFELRIVCNAGAFVSGEETALIKSVEGSVAEPIPRPPFPAQKGLNGQPTCINNVETWANVPLIIEKGADWFKDIGAEKNGGTKLFSLSGKVKNTGLVEIPMGTSIRDVVFEIGDGIIEDKPFKAVQTGGPAGGCIPESMLDLPLTYEGLAEAGAIMGSGGMIVLDSETCMVDVARYFLNFSTKESCGKCTPCREGNAHMLEILDRICKGEGQEEDLAILERLSKGVAASSLCGLGQNSPNPVLSTLKYFRHEYETHIREKRCKPGVCMDLVKAKCINACPLEQDVPGYISLVHEGRYAEAISLIYQTNPMPGICGRVCPHPCMDVCLRNQTDEALAISKIKRFAADMARKQGITVSVKKAPSIGQKVAVVGGGPGGLAAAYHLALMGYQPTIFEELPKLGGMLRYGIPAYRLPRDILDEEIAFILNVGVKARTDTRVGRDVFFEDLQKDNDAVFIAVGAHQSISMRISGEELEGVQGGAEFLREVELGKSQDVGRKVAVIGGGNAAIDVARTCLRMGAEVTILYRRQRKDMPAYEEEIEDALAEGIELKELVAPKSISQSNGRLKIELHECELGAFDRSGRRRPVPIEEGVISQEFDTIFSAIGQAPDLSFSTDLTTHWDTISVDSRTLATNLDGVFAGGDAATGPARVVDALAAGRRAAFAIDEYLALKRGDEPYVEDLEKISVTMEVPADHIECGRAKSPKLSPEERIESFDEVELGFDEKTAIEECVRCLRCDVKEVAPQ